MLTERMIPMLWFRLVVVIGFAIFVATQKMWLVMVIAIVLAGLTGWQLQQAYQNKKEK